MKEKFITKNCSSRLGFLSQRHRFILARVLIAKRERKDELLNLSRTSELKAPSSKFLKQCAFTLAEVLITLGIIGIVAESTIPALMHNYQIAVSKAALKTVYATFAAATESIKNDNGGSMIGVWTDFTSLYYNDDTEFSKLYSKYISTDKVCYSNPQVTDVGQCWHKNGTTRNENNSLCLADCWCAGCSTLQSRQGFWAMLGGVYSYSCDADAGGGLHNVCIYFVVDTNGIKKPNRLGYDIQYLYITKDGVAYPNVGNIYDLMTK